MAIKSRRLRLEAHVTRMGEYSSLKTLTVESTARRPLGKPRNRWEDNIRKYINPLSGYFAYLLTLPQ